MHKIFDGIAAFQRDVFPKRKELFSKLANGQEPEVLFITCADSRVDPNLITQTDPGELFICRNAGNIVPPHFRQAGGVTASIEFGVAALNIPHIVVCGHTDCGAMKGALAPEGLDALPHVADWLSHSHAACATVKAKLGTTEGPEALRTMTEENVRLQMKHLQTHPAVAARLATGSIQIHGWVYDIESGTVLALNPETDTFEPLENGDGRKRA